MTIKNILPNIVENKGGGSLWIRIFTIILWGQAALSPLLTAFFKRLPLLGNVAEYVLPASIFIIFLFTISYFFRNISLRVFALVLLFYVVVLFQFIAYPANSEAQTLYVPNLVTMLIPMTIFFGAIRIRLSIHDLLYVSIFCVLVHYYLFRYVWTFDESTELMNLAYNLLPHVLLLCWWALKQPNIISIGSALLGSFVLLACGNRGSIFAVVVFFALYLIFWGDKKHEGKKVTRAIIGVLFIMLVFSDFIFGFLVDKFTSMGFNTRVFVMLMENEYMDSNGRDEIGNAVMRYISSDSFPFFGLGLFGDQQITGSYSHNIILEIICEFGFFVSFIIICALSYLIIVLINRYKHTIEGGFWGVLLCSCIQLLFSSSYLMTNIFFSFLGYSLYLLYNKKNILE